jgi:hypothetical protein
MPKIDAPMQRRDALVHIEADHAAPRAGKASTTPYRYLTPRR